MCLTCGCMQPENRHGDQRNITRSDLLAATQTKAAGGISLDDAVKSFDKTVKADRATHEDLYTTENAETKA